jgi:hypothetical protein
MGLQTGDRRDLTYFLLGPVAIALLASAWFHVAPWPVFSPLQGQLFDWGTTVAYLAGGALGILACARIGIPRAPTDGAGWRKVVLWGLGTGIAYAAFDLALPVHAHAEAVDKAAGITWSNVALPFSLLHYAHAAIISECFFRIAVIAIPTWLVSTLLLKGRWKAPVFWAFAVFAAFIEPLEKAVLKHLPLTGMSAIDTAMTLEGVAWQLIFAYLMRRFGWPAPILARYGYYLLFRITAGYFYPHTSGMYPGPH